MNDNLVFLEFNDETHAYVSQYNKNSGSNTGDIVIPLALSARLILQKNNIPFKTTIDYFDSYAHSRALVRSEEWLKTVETAIASDTPLAAELCFCLRPLFNYLLWLAEIIANAAERHQTLKIIAAEGVLPNDAYHWKLIPQERYIGFLVNDYAQKKNKHFAPLNFPPPPTTFPETVPATSSDQLRRHKPGFTARILRTMIKRHLRKHHTILLASDSYGLGKLMHETVNRLQHHRINIAELDMDPWNTNAKRLFKRLLLLLRRKFSAAARQTPQKVPLYVFPPKEDAVNPYPLTVNRILQELVLNIEGPWRKQFEHRGFDLAPLIVYKVQNGIGKHLETLAHQLGRLESLVETISPHLVFSPYSGDIHTWLGHLCQKQNIPAVMVTHGTHIPPRNRMDEIEQWRLSRNLMLAPTYKYTVAQSPWATRHAEFYGFKDTTLDTGPLLYARTDAAEKEKLRRDLGIPPDGLLAVYAVTQRKRSSVKFHVFETEDEYLQDMADLVDAVNQLPNVYLILKLHPSSEFSDADIRSVLPPCERLFVLHKEPFHRVLSATDVLISYSSTTIEEAVLNKIPVVQYDRWKRYCHLSALDCDSGTPEEWPADAVYYVRDPQRLAAVLSHALEMAETASQRESLYKNHLFSSGQHQPLGYHIERFLAK